MAGFLIYGGSTAQGYFDQERGGWVRQLEQSFIEKGMAENSRPPDIINYGFRATRITDAIEDLPSGIARFHRPSIRRGAKLQRLFVIVQPGAADCAWEDTNATAQTVPPEEYKKKLVELGQLCIDQLSAPPILVTMQPFISKEEADLDLSRTSYFNFNGREEYNEYTREVAKKHNFPLADAQQAFEERKSDGSWDPPLHAPDGMHPNSLGHAVICHTVLTVAMKMFTQHSSQFL